MFHHQRRSNRLNTYLLRSTLTFFGPLFVLGFYAFICLYYFGNPPVDQTINFQAIDGRFPFYVWFIIAILSLDWARAGLANIEAAAIMHPSIAPRTASQLMWHVDSNWSNLLWWLRYLKSAVLYFSKSRKSSGAHVSNPISLPNALWAMMSFTTALLLVAVSLSGLSMELTTVSMPSHTNVNIYGPNETTFHYSYQDDLMRQINSNWRSGRQTTPPDGSMFYAPAGTQNVSKTYFDTRAAANAASIQTFLGPAVHQDVIGEVWGIYTNVSCRTGQAHTLQMIQVLGVGNHSIYGCREELSGVFSAQTCHLDWLDPSLEKSSTTIWPAWVNETENRTVLTGKSSPDLVSALTSLVAVADGLTGNQMGCYEGDVSCAPPNQFLILTNTTLYSAPHAHDNWTFDSLINGREYDQPTTAMFELYTWQPVSSKKVGVQSYLSTWTDIDTMPLQDPTGPQLDETQGVSIGIGIHCDIETIPGSAMLDPVQRTFSSFRHVQAHPWSTSSDTYNGIWQVSPIEALAVGSLAANQIYGGTIRPLKRRSNQNSMTVGVPMGQLSMYNSLGITFTLDFDSETPTTPILTPPNIQQAIYKLLGESLITSMKDTNRDPWTSPKLYKLRTTRYIVQGTISWKPVLALLAMWAFIMSAGALGLICLAGPRWAPTLNGFELFKFGAQYAPQISTFTALDFRECSDSLQNIPGMVGALPGDESPSVSADKVFIGLSENEVSKDFHHRHNVEIVFDRKTAASTRSWFPLQRP